MKTFFLLYLSSWTSWKSSTTSWSACISAVLFGKSSILVGKSSNKFITFWEDLRNIVLNLKRYDKMYIELTICVCFAKRILLPWRVLSFFLYDWRIYLCCPFLDILYNNIEFHIIHVIIYSRLKIPKTKLNST